MRYLSVKSISLAGHVALMCLPLSFAFPFLSVQAEELKPRAAVKFLNQATFGATPTSIKVLQAQGIDKWLSNQTNMPPCLHFDIAVANQKERAHFLGEKPPEGKDPKRPNYYKSIRESIWLDNAMKCESQLQQRVAFALSQIMVISDQDAILRKHQESVVDYYDVLVTHSLGNFRDLLEAVALHPAMGIYLSMINNQKPDPALNIRPDENFAREIMQLFTIGLDKLRQNGKPVMSKGQTIPTYTQEDIVNLARIFTGWVGSLDQRRNGKYRINYLEPMKAVEDRHDKGQKVFLGQTFPANGRAAEEMSRVLDILFEHPNVGPFIGKQLIKRLVKSNPSQGYVVRVSRVFNDNGVGVRGDLAAVVKAVLTDQEALKKGGEKRRETNDKMIQPLLKMVRLWRAFEAQPAGKGIAGYSFKAARLKDSTGQMPLNADSVFNFYEPEYAAPSVGELGLVSPEFKLLNENNAPSMHLRIGKTILRDHLDSLHSVKKSADVHLNFGTQIDLFKRSPNKAIQQINTLLMAGDMSKEMRQLLLGVANDANEAGKAPEETVAQLIFLTVISPEYNVQ